MIIEKQLEVQNIKINYRISGDLKSSKILFILHGWNQNGSQSWEDFIDQDCFSEFLMIAPDMPCFGKSQDLSKVFGVLDYAVFMADFLQAFCNSNNIENISELYLLGHSFGGSICTVITSQKLLKPKKLILSGPAIVRKQPSSRNKTIKKIANFGNITFGKLPFFGKYIKKLFYKIIGSPDYNLTSGIKRQIMQKILLQDTTNYINNIDIPISFFWGS
jgi:pimeloyl-ACP methyl ester carboxylesterase